MGYIGESKKPLILTYPNHLLSSWDILSVDEIEDLHLRRINMEPQNGDLEDDFPL